MNFELANNTINGAITQTVNARDLHRNLGVGKDFSNWVKAQINRADLAENTDYLVIAQKGAQLPSGAKHSIDYHLTIDAAKNIAMLSGTAKGKQVRAYFIECENKLKTGSSLPVVKDPVLAAHIRTLIEVDAIKTEQQRQAGELARIQESVAVIEARTQPENKHFTVLGYANLVGKKIDLTIASKLGRKCVDLSREQGLPIGDVRDPRFGTVHSYHESVLQAVLDSSPA